MARSALPVVFVNDGESIENALRRFSRAVEASGLMADLRAHESFDSRRTRRARKSAAARKRRGG